MARQSTEHATTKTKDLGTILKSLFNSNEWRRIVNKMNLPHKDSKALCKAFDS